METKPGKHLMFDPDGFTGRLRAFPFQGMWRALLCGKVPRLAADGTRGCSVFLAEG